MGILLLEFRFEVFKSRGLGRMPSVVLKLSIV